MAVFTSFSSQLGKIYIAATDNGICRLSLQTVKEMDWLYQLQEQFKQPFEKDTATFAGLTNELMRYLNGERVEFNLKLDLSLATGFQQRVWQAVRDIPYGQRRSYKEIAFSINQPHAVRAVGQANAKNPILLLIPCHRVIGSKGHLGGFSYGIEIKEKLLRLESEGVCS